MSGKMAVVPYPATAPALSQNVSTGPPEACNVHLEVHCIDCLRHGYRRPHPSISLPGLPLLYSLTARMIPHFHRSNACFVRRLQPSPHRHWGLKLLTHPPSSTLPPYSTPLLAAIPPYRTVAQGHPKKLLHWTTESTLRLHPT